MKRKLPDAKGHFGPYGGRYVPETLVKACRELTVAYQQIKNDKKFRDELRSYLETYAGRPTPLYEAKNLSAHFGRGRIFLKREDLLHTGAHKINNTLAQGLLAKRLGKTRIVAETGAGQHGVATATVAALFGLDCVVYMGAEDVKRQALNVYRMELLGTEVRAVKSGTQTLKEAINEALRDWMGNVSDTYYLIGSCMGPHPYPMMVRDFQSVIGKETKEQIQKAEGKLPDLVLACVGGGSNSIGMFHPFIDDTSVQMIGVEAAGCGLKTPKHSATIEKGSEGILHGMQTYVLQTKDGQISETHSISAGLDYPGVGPEHAYLHDIGRVKYDSVTDKEALEAFELLSKEEGIIPALESSHAVAYLEKLKGKLSSDKIVVVCLSGRGDKDLDIVRNK